MRNINDITKHDFLKIMQWCKTHLNCKNGKPTPALRFEGKQKYDGWHGLYDWDENLIIIRLDGHETIEDLCDTIIHEWCHYLQPVRQFQIRDKGMGYKRNPYEREAERRAKVWKGICYNEVFKQ